MKPGFALSLSYEGMSLLHRAAGGWRLVGSVALDSMDMTGDLAALRDKALVLEPGGLRCKIILPNEQIRYLSIETGSFDGEARDAMVRSALDGSTPYAVDDLAYDIAGDGSQTHVAAVARVTLAEAEAFAVDHQFNPVCFVAIPDDNPFLGEPFFGAADHAASLPEGGEVEPDGIAVVEIGPAELPPEPVVEPAPEPEPEVAPEPVISGFTSRRAKKPGPAPALDGARRDVPQPVIPVAPAEPESAPEQPQPDPDPTPAAVPEVAFGGNVEPEPEVSADPAPAYEPEVEPEPEPEYEPDPISVTAPTLDIPEFTDPDQPVTPETASAFGRFLSRRSKKDNTQPTPVAPPPSPMPAPPPPSRSHGQLPRRLSAMAGRWGQTKTKPPG